MTPNHKVILASWITSSIAFGVWMDNIYAGIFLFVIIALIGFTVNDFID